ncbi:MAG TPA: ribose-5-phosphate isomerase RpiA [Nitrososphaerales archaeon]|jgi:ribose 5-phosphate isomerase A|nr:ribose-5-phosphate isomerase RpiA [Nitrososphaerales archaeon]NSL75319.1 ribose-5-phosphate isomerase RpiA [Nitrososphaerota archaeon]NSL77392.1 ribose-5-phosphate isomerase RpiA [Nitrososphaerota archaeon]HIC84264.1 ribose-5-phosphate isomerase RpiA [Nitrososphaerales archaeon]
MSKEDALQKMGEQAAQKITSGQLVGLGSGSAVAAFVNALGKRITDENLDVRGIPTSMQVEIIAQNNGIVLESPSLIPEIDVVVDGADEIDKNHIMIKGGGGAHYREKIMIEAANHSIIIADSSKYVDVITWPVPLEVSEFSRFFVEEKIKSNGGNPVIRTLNKGYPFFTQNGNLVIDAHFNQITEPLKLEQLLLNIPGIIANGIFSMKIDTFLRANEDGSVEVG